MGQEAEKGVSCLTKTFDVYNRVLCQIVHYLQPCCSQLTTCKTLWDSNFAKVLPSGKIHKEMPKASKLESKANWK